jgi:ribonuclease Z
MKTISRILVTLAAMTFLAVGVSFLMTPEKAAEQFGLAALSGSGMVNVRADLGGLFIGLAMLCGVGAWTKRRAPLLAAAAVLAAVLVGRTVGWAADGRVEFGTRELGIELVAMVALVVLSRKVGVESAPVKTESRKVMRFVAAGLGLLTLTSATIMNPTVEQAIYDKGAMAFTGRVNDAPLADDALRVAIAGSSAPLPSASRAKASVVVFAGGKNWVIDSGPESTENLVLWGVPLSKIGGVLLTHFHSDHIGDLGELHLQTWAGGRKEKLAVYGGPGVERVVNGFNEAYALDQGYRTAHHGEEVMPSRAWGMVAHTVTLEGPATPAKDRTARVYDDGALRITAIEVDHAPIAPAYAYRFDYKGRSVVVTGDLKYHRPLVKSAANVDVLVSEAISRSMTRSLETAANAVNRGRTAAIMHDVQDYHISPEEAATIANDANVNLLVYYHLLPAPDGFLARRLFSSGVNKVRKGEWNMADDGSLYTLPLGSKEVRIGKIG